MENEIRYYLKYIQTLMSPEEPKPDTEIFTPQYLITAVKLPTGAIEIAMNTSDIYEKISYILEAYDDNMHLKVNPEIEMRNIMVV